MINSTKDFFKNANEIPRAQNISELTTHRYECTLEMKCSLNIFRIDFSVQNDVWHI